MTREQGRTLGLVAVFLVLAGIGVLRHEMWRDELEIWLIARASASPVELLRNMSLEGHPGLWYLLVWGVARLVPNPLAMQLLSLAIGTATVLVVLRAAPFPFWARALFCFGYYPLYEFTILSRNYGLELLLLVLACVAYERRRGHELRLGIVLALLAHTHLFGAILASCLASLLAFDLRARREARAATGVALAVAAVGAAVAVAHVAWQASRIGPTHKSYEPGFDLRWALDGLATILHGFVPLQDVGLHGWSTSLFDRLPGLAGEIATALAGVALWIASARVLRARPAVLAAFCGGSAVILGFLLFLWHGEIRHHGQFWILFFACLWLARPDRPLAAVPRWIGAILVLQALAAGQAWVADVRHPFSRARDTARFLAEPRFREAPIVGSIDYAAQAVAGYLGRPIHYPEIGRAAPFMHWGPERRLVSPEEVLGQAAELRRRTGRDVVVVLNWEPRAPAPGQTVKLADDLAVEALARFEPAIVADEQFYVYRVFDPRTH